MSNEEQLSKPVRMYTDAGRAVIITHSYTGNPPDDPHGYYYHYEDAPNQRHWISNSAMGIRFKHEKPAEPRRWDGTAEHARVLHAESLTKATGSRREAVILAAMLGVERVANNLGVVSVASTDKGFCVVYSNDDTMYFDAVEI